MCLLYPESPACKLCEARLLEDCARRTKFNAYHSPRTRIGCLGRICAQQRISGERTARSTVLVRLALYAVKSLEMRSVNAEKPTRLRDLRAAQLLDS